MRGVDDFKIRASEEWQRITREWLATTPLEGFRLRLRKEAMRRAMGVGKAAMDLGCGGGSNLPYLLERYENVVGFDMGQGAQLAVKRGALAVRGDAEALPLSSSCLDFVLCSELIEHLQSPGKMLSEVNRVLHPGGHLVITTPNHMELQRIAFRGIVWGLTRIGRLPRDRVRISLRNLYSRVTARAVRGLPQHISLDPHQQDFTPGNLKRLALANGFEVVSHQGVGLSPPFGFPFNRFPRSIKVLEVFEAFITRTPLSYLFAGHQVAVLQKKDE